MKFTLSHGFIGGLALVALTNAVVLSGAMYNRAGEPDATLALGERELRPARLLADRENSGLALRLRWRVRGGEGTLPGYYTFEAPPWLNRVKMASLGFDVSLPDTDVETRRSFNRELPRDVLLVLELEGPAYQESLRAAEAQAEKMRQNPNEEARRMADQVVPNARENASRLFVVDAGLDRGALRAKYPDRSHYAIVRGQVAPMGAYNRSATAHAGYVKSLSIAAINVPLERRAVFEGAAPDLYESLGQPRMNTVKYDALVAFGRRLEPWIVEAQRK